MRLHPYKFVVQAIVQEVEDGDVIAERPVDPVVLFGTDALRDWAVSFSDELAATQAIAS